MGRELCLAALETEGVELAGGVEGSEASYLGAELGELIGVGNLGIAVTQDPPNAAEVLIEFTTPEATVEHLSYQRPVVIGTTGLSEGQHAKVEEAAKSVPIVLAPNMSVGVNLLREVVRRCPGSSRGTT
jgi:4-hydroxy-tetrahydrodipicolinate reductase